MIRHWTLSRYFGRQFLLWFAVFAGSLGGIIFLFQIAELMRRAMDRPEATFLIVLKMGFYQMPDVIQHILPFVVLFAGMFTFWRLTRSHELVVARAAGVSAWQFLAPALLIIVAFSFFNLTILNPVGALFNSRYKQMESRYLKRMPTLELTGAGLWLRQRDTDRRYLLHADQVQMEPLTLEPVIVFIYDAEDHYIGRIDAPRAVLERGFWNIPDAWLNWDQQAPIHSAQYQLPTTLTLDKIQESLAPPNTISFWELPNFVHALKAVGLPSTRHQLEFQNLLAQPVMLCAMVFFAAAFSLRMSRRGNTLSLIVAGAGVGIVLFMANNMVVAMGDNRDIPVALAAWAIPLASLALGNAALLHLEDG